MRGNLLIQDFLLKNQFLSKFAFFISSNLILRKDKIFIFVDNDERLERPGFIGSVNHQVYQQESKRQYIL